MILIKGPRCFKCSMSRAELCRHRLHLLNLDNLNGLFQRGDVGVDEDARAGAGGQAGLAVVGRAAMAGTAADDHPAGTAGVHRQGVVNGGHRREAADSGGAALSPVAVPPLHPPVIGRPGAERAARPAVGKGVRQRMTGATGGAGDDATRTAGGVGIGW